MKRLLGVLLALLLIVPVAADRLAAARAGSVVADRARAAMSLSQASADVHGFPFVTQLLGDRLRHVTVTTDRANRDDATFENVTVDAFGVEVRRRGLSDVAPGERADHATLRVGRLRNSQGEIQDVRARANGIGLGSRVTLDQVTGEGIVSNSTIAAQVKQRTGVDVTVAKKDDDLTVAGTVLGQPLTAVAAPSVVKGGLRVGLDHVMLGDTPVSAETVRRLTGMRQTAVTVPVDLSSLPGLTLSGVDVDQQGLKLHLAGKDLTLER